MNFIHENFLLHSEAAQRLYHEYAAPQPILDYHSHLPARDIAADRRFGDLFEIWLEGDHYKWRAMRANGVPERCCTGDASADEKFQAWARTVPYTLRNPLYHWTHLELKRYFDIDELLNECSAKAIWNRANALLHTDDLSVHGILRKFGVRAVCTSDDPCDDLAAHRAVNKSCLGFRVYPTFRPDNALLVHMPELFRPWVERLEAASNLEVSTFSAFLEALSRRHTFFHESGGRLSDHGLSYCYAKPCLDAQAAGIFARARAGRAASPEEQEQFASFMMVYFGRLDAERGWTKQLHLGALRNVNTRRLAEIGTDAGFDSVGDWSQARALAGYLDLLEREHSLPRMVVYNINPASNYVFATMAGNFQDETIAGKIQFGSAWWFLDHKEGMERQLNALSASGLLARFIGMVTDSRSFMSFPRHEYFRRVLCNLLGEEMEQGELPKDERLVGNMVRNICFENARQYLGLEVPCGEKGGCEATSS
ncbi:MAG TPA: glucuronate isomerase [Terriglobales bacterium]|nr:glucuronate isomerase [Terriglobales bacterium]